MKRVTTSTVRRFLVNSPTEGEACGKVILLGEHAAVDGHPAIALPLKDRNLRVLFPVNEDGTESLVFTGTEADSILECWDQCWSLLVNGSSVELPDQERKRLTHSLELALRLLTDQREGMQDFFPQPIVIDSRIPLGAGMGGSAALSAALMRALGSALGLQLTRFEVGRLANELDGMFHGRASGLDAATVVSDSIIRFQKDQGSSPLKNARGFWLLLIDTVERTPTREMVARVASLRERNPALVVSCFSALSELVEKSACFLQTGELEKLGSAFTQAHQLLRHLGVSTPQLDLCVDHLLQEGALGAKLTGGGGGGLAFGVFANKPSLPLGSHWASAPHFLTFVPADKTS